MAHWPTVRLMVRTGGRPLPVSMQRAGPISPTVSTGPQRWLRSLTAPKQPVGQSRLSSSCANCCAGPFPRHALKTAALGRLAKLLAHWPIVTWQPGALGQGSRKSEPRTLLSPLAQSQLAGHKKRCACERLACDLSVRLASAGHAAPATSRRASARWPTSSTTPSCVSGRWLAAKRAQVGGGPSSEARPCAALAEQNCASAGQPAMLGGWPVRPLKTSHCCPGRCPPRGR